MSGLGEKPQGFERAMGLVAGGGTGKVIGDRSQYDGSTEHEYVDIIWRRTKKKKVKKIIISQLSSYFVNNNIYITVLLIFVK